MGKMKKLQKQRLAKSHLVFGALVLLALVTATIVSLLILRSQNKKTTTGVYMPYTFQDCARDFGVQKSKGYAAVPRCQTNDGKTYSEVPSYEKRLGEFIDCVEEFGYHEENKFQCVNSKTHALVTKPFSEIVNSYDECIAVSHDPRLDIYPGSCVDPKTGRVFTQNKD